MRAYLRSIFIFFYSVAVALMLPFARFLSLFLRSLRDQLADRKSLTEISRPIAKARAAKRHAILFFCSSAGEYEQAKPLINRLGKRSDLYILIVFFSRSGYDYARSKGESVPFILSPADTIWHWGWLLSALRPDACVVVRHELWPAFLETAHHWGPLYLIDASWSQGESTSRFKRMVRRWLLDYFQRIYTVTDKDRSRFESSYRLTSSKLLVTGDTKYDSARERTTSDEVTFRLKGILDATAGGRRKLIIGSAHPPDLEACLMARRALRDFADDWLIVVAPHHVDKDRVTSMHGRCRAEGLSVALYTEVGDHPPHSCDVFFLDTMGLLGDAYGLADLAIVGGAFHHQIHNVLEPACHGLALAFGPFYKNSNEAIHLVESGLARVVRDGGELSRWWKEQAQEAPDRRVALKDSVAGLCGATDRILDDWTTDFHAR